MLGAFLVLAASGGAVGVVALFSGCSDDPTPPPADAGADREPTANRPVRPEEDGAPPASCRAQCAEAHPTGVPKDEAIDACWKASCAAPCVEEQPDDGGVDGAAPDAGTCVSPVVTVSLACDACTTASCCASWDDCFQDPECAALNACYQQCVE